MDQTRQISSSVIIALLFLLPIFFIPGGALNLSDAKSSLLALGVIVLALVFLFEIWRKRELNFPRHLFVLTAVLLPIVYFVSALSSTPSALSLFGYNFEVGTFGYIFLSSILLIIVSTTFTETSKFLHALITLFISLSLVAVFLAIKVLSGGFPVLGIFPGITDNPIGRWTDLATALGLLSMLSILILGIVPMKKSFRIFSFTMFTLSTVLLAIVNFFTAFVFTLIISVMLFVYFMTIEKRFSDTASVPPQVPSLFIFRPTLLLAILGLISVVFLINPNISSTRGSLGNVVANTFNVVNTEVRPSFSATLTISKAALSQGILLGSGPNTFSRDWLVHKPVNVNATPFWSVSFPFGIGFIPTQIASTGILGTVSWLVFFIFLILLMIKVLANLPESRTLRFSLVSSLVALLYLWMASFMYTPSLTLLTLAFIFSGMFIAASRQAGIIGSRVISLSRDAATNIISIILMVIIGLASVYLGFIAVEKTISAFYFQEAVDLSNKSGTALETLEAVLDKAVKFAPADVHYTALSKVYFAQAQAVALDSKSDPEKNLVIFQEAISRSITSAREAVSINPTSYQNWIALGAVYSYLVPKPFAVAGAYENAILAYNEAKNKNPLNPEVPLFIARLELNKENISAARSSIRESLALKEDYADAYLMLAQLEIQDGNINEAIDSAEKLALLIPNNPAIYFELGLLKYSDRDYVGAENAFSLALKAAPNYANAMYYLGLSLSQLGRLDEALVQFEALSVTNPDSEEVQLILKDLEKGKTSFLK